MPTGGFGAAILCHTDKRWLRPTFGVVRRTGGIVYWPDSGANMSSSESNSGSFAFGRFAPSAPVSTRKHKGPSTKRHFTERDFGTVSPDLHRRVARYQL